MNEVFFPVRHHEMPLHEASRDADVVVLLAYVMAPPEHVLSQTGIWPILHQIFRLDYPQLSMAVPGYYAAGYEPDGRALTLSDGKLFSFSQSIYDLHVARMRMFGWRPSGRPGLVLVAAQAAHGGGWNFGEEPMVVDLTAIHDQPVASFIGNLLVELHDWGQVAKSLNESAGRMRALIGGAMVPEQESVGREKRLLRS